MSQPATRWGIVSAGLISHDFAVALATLDRKEHIITAVAARSLERAKEFAATHNIPKYYDNYAMLGIDSNIDVVYIGSINTEHKWIAMKMLESGKHVLCEKPMCLNEKDTRELCDLAKKKNLFLMEAMWSRFFPSYMEMKRMVDDGEIGEVMQINVDFGVPISQVDRLKKRELGGGTIHDLGIYTLQLQQLFFGTQHEKLVAVAELNDEGMDEVCAVIIKYPGGKIANISTNSRIVTSNVAEVMGTKGYIQIPFFWCPEKVITATETKTFNVPEPKLPLNFKNSTGLSYEAVEVRRCILNGITESSKFTQEESIHLAYLRDEIRKQIGMKNIRE